MNEEKTMSERESLAVINKMIAAARNSHHDNGTGAILWGSVIAFCALFTWVELHFGLRYSFDIWLLTLVAIIPTIILSVRESRLRKVVSYDQVAMDYAWMCFGIGMFLVIHANIQVNAQFVTLKDTIEQAGMQRLNVNFVDYSSSYLLVMYGIPTLITAGIKQFKPMFFGGIVCWVAAFICIYTPREVDMLLMASAAISAWLIPGLILRKYCRRQKQDAHV